MDTNDDSFFRPSRRKRQAEQGIMPIFFDELNITEEAEMVCEGNPQCIFDLLLTGDMDVAMNTLEHEKQTNLSMETISKDAILIL